MGELLQAAPRLRVLTTSRARLRLYGEHELEIPPLPAGDAEELFLGRARATGRALPPGSLVTDICRRLDGLPLAIELVAARTAELTPAELMSSLADSLELASKGARDLPERQRTLRAAIGWSHDLLDADGQRLFAHLGAFAGGFTREAVRGGVRRRTRRSTSPPWPRPASCDAPTTAATGCSRRSASTPSSGLPIAATQWTSAAATPSTSAELGEELVVALPREAVDEAYATFEREHDNYSAALAFAAETGSTELRFRLAAAVSHFWLVRGHLAEGRAWLEETLAPASARDDAVAPARPGAAQARDARVASGRLRRCGRACRGSACLSSQARSTRMSATGF